MTKRDHQPRRRQPVRQERSKILVFCGGEKTEPAYLEGLRLLCRDKPVVLEVKAKSESPARLVEHVAELAHRNRGFFDEIWCVVDVDDFDVASAVALAEPAGIRLAVSNPCFEVWLLLHHVPHTAAMENCDKVAGKLLKALPRYEKTRLKFGDFVAGVEDAIARGKKLDPTGEDHKRNPSTGMWRLVERILK